MTRFYSKSVLAVIISVISGLSANSLTIVAPMALTSVFSCSSSTTDSGTPSDPPTDPPDDPPIDPPTGTTFPTLTTTIVADGFSSPIYVTSLPNDINRLVVVEQMGKIRLVESGTVRGTAFLDIDDRVSNSGGERGLLGLTFHPNYPASAYIYVNYTGNDGGTRISRFTVNTTTNIADPSTEKFILQVGQPHGNHNAGMLEFGPDGYLYIGLGDGGSANDPDNRAQNPLDFLGKMLRIDIDGGDPYAIPADNPYVGVLTHRDEIWSMGWRNPWRFCFDRQTGDMYVADVGQGEIEEISFESAGHEGGANYGWRLKEGSACFNPSSNCDPDGRLTDPIYDYNHNNGRCSVTGGYVYRGAIEGLDGYYFFGDYCTGEVWAFTYDGTSVNDVRLVLNLSALQLSSFGEDIAGELYIVELGSGRLLKIIESTT